MDLDKLVIPSVCLAAVVFSVAAIKGCVVESGIEKTKKLEIYLNSGCSKIPVAGSTGTHWVCPNTDEGGADD